MAISTITRQEGPITTVGHVASFTFGFKVFQPSDLLVLYTPAGGSETELQLHHHYTVRLLPDQDATPGGTVWLRQPASFHGSFVATSQVANTQPAVLTNQGAFFPVVVNQALDRATIQIQQLAWRMSRLTGGVAAPGGGGGGSAYPMPTPEAGKVIGWNTLGTALVNIDRADLGSGGGGGGDPDLSLRTDLANLSGSSLVGHVSGFNPPTTVSAELIALRDMATDLQFIPITRATLNGNANFGLLRVNRFYYITDEQRLAFSTSVAGYFEIAKRSELGSGGGGTSGRVKVAFIGDSMVSQHIVQSDAWPTLWESRMNSLGARVEVYNLALGGWTFHRARNTLSHGGGSKSMLTACIDLAPDVVFVHMGYNDVIFRVDGRSLSQAQSDAQQLLSELRAALPSATICYVSEIPYDRQNFPTPRTNLKNKGVPPLNFQKRTSGILSGLYSSEILDDQVSASMRGGMGDWNDLDAYIKGLGSINTHIAVNQWRVARLGAMGLDGIHATAAGNHILAAYGIVGARENAVLRMRWPDISLEGYGPWTHPDTLFSEMLQSSGDGWVTREGAIAADFVSRHWAGFALNPDTWYMRTGGSLKVGLTTYPANPNLPTYWMLRGGPIRQQAYVSVNGGEWSASGAHSDSRGDILALTNAMALPPGTYTLRYKIGDESYGPIQVTVEPWSGTGPGVAPHVEVYQGANQLLASNTWNTLVSMAVKTNLGGGSFSAGTYTVPVAGRYAVSLNTGLLLGSGVSVIAGVAVNGTVQLEGNPVTGVNAYAGSVVSGVLNLAAGASLSLRVYSYGTATLEPGARARSATATISYLGA